MALIELYKYFVPKVNILRPTNEGEQDEWLKDSNGGWIDALFCLPKGPFIMNIIPNLSLICSLLLFTHTALRNKVLCRSSMYIHDDACFPILIFNPKAMLSYFPILIFNPKETLRQSHSRKNQKRLFHTNQKALKLTISCLHQWLDETKGMEKGKGNIKYHSHHGINLKLTNYLNHKGYLILLIVRGAKKIKHDENWHKMFK